jgi:anti-sigma regulatory factor (Ser/Thr protein kinase)
MMVRAAPLSSGPTRLRLVLPGILSERPRALRFITGVCRAHALPSDVEHALISAFGEAFNHAVLHSYRDLAGTLAVEIELGDEHVTVQLRDRGAGFDTRGGDPATLTERRYGLFIMLRAMDEVRWYKEGDENVVVLCKRIPGARQTT